jgi:hypothetical protein
LTDHPEITNWVCIDDLELGESDNYGNVHEWGLKNFVWTPNEKEGIKQQGIKDRVLQFLK